MGSNPVVETTKHKPTVHSAGWAEGEHPKTGTAYHEPGTFSMADVF